jgi:hypothetical protein
MIVIGLPQIIARFVERSLFGANLRAVTLDPVSDNNALSDLYLKPYLFPRDPELLRLKSDQDDGEFSQI